MNANKTDRRSGFSYTMFSVLSEPDRAKILTHLMDQPNPVRTADLVGLLTTAGGDGSSNQSDTDRKKAAIELYHTYLPKLRDAGLVDISPDGKSVTLLRPASQLKPYLELADNPPT